MTQEIAKADRPRRRGLLALWPLALGLVLAPFAYEGAASILNRWRRISGMISSVVSTPISDATFAALSGSWRTTWESCLRLAESTGQHPNWSIGIAAFWMVLGSGFLLRKH